MTFAAIFAAIFTLLLWGIDQYNISKNKTKTKNSKRMKDIKYGQTFQGNDSGIGIIAVIIFIIFFGIFFAVIYFGMKAQTQRYSLASDAIKRGDKTTAMAALAPEIGMGIENAEEGLGDIIWNRHRGY